MDCTATADYKVVPTADLIPTVIKSGITLAGVTGIYPSAAAPLSANTTAKDLTSFGPTTLPGVYEYFDSAGNVYPATVLDGATVTPGLTAQRLSATGSLYRRVSISGDANLVAGNIKSGISVFGIAGNVTLPAIGKVLTGTAYGVSGTSLSGTLTLPLAANVVSGSGTYGDPGSVVTPSYSISFPTLLVRPVAPTVTSTAFNFTPDRVTINWSIVAGATGYIVLLNNSQAVTWTPSDGVTYTTGTYGSDTMIYTGTANTVTHNTTVGAGTNFYFAVYAYQANTVYSAASTKTMLSCEGLAVGTWVPVPGDTNYGTNGFCVQKYIPSNVSGVPVSQTGTTPWVSINQTNAKSACLGLGAGYHLITNPEWMTIAANIANTGSNWSGGSVGSGTLARGHSDNSPASACAADANDANGWVETTCTGQTQGALTWQQKRTRTLSNNYIIWDLGGNVWQWVDYNNASDKPTPATGVYYEYTAITGSTATPKSHLTPLNSAQTWWLDSWNSTQGIGQINPGTNSSGGGLNRGASWNDGSIAGPFAGRLTTTPSGAYPFIGLRCAWQP